MRNQHTFVKTVPLNFCTGCSTQKTTADFHRGSATRCKRCATTSLLAWKQRNPRKARAQKLRHRYGIDMDAYDNLFAAQGGKCAVCGLPQAESVKPLEVDHDHATNAVRGLLCQNCNKCLGLFHDNVAVILRAATYLGAHRGQ